MLLARNYYPTNRRGAVLPLFALILPALIILCGFAINLAYLQLVSTEMKVATDAAAHAGGRALSIHQSTDAAYDAARINAQTNQVAGAPLILNTAQADHDIQFGLSTRVSAAQRYDFNFVTKAQVDAGNEQATSIRVIGQRPIPLVFRVMEGLTNVNVSRRSIATQLDRDIGLILDRSGSMLAYEDLDEWNRVLDRLYRWRRINYSEWRYARYYYTSSKVHQYVSFNVAYEIMRYLNGASYYDDYSNAWIPGGYYWEDRETRWSRYPTSRLRTNGDTRFNNPYGSVEPEMARYAFDMSLRRNNPRFSRWYRLVEAVDAFTDVLEFTDQKELIALVTFSSDASADLSLQPEGNTGVAYEALHNEIQSLHAYGATAIGKGLQEGFPLIIEDENGVYEPNRNPPDPRPFAAKTIVVLTDGRNNKWPDPVAATEDALAEHRNVTVHTVTFSPGADQSKMRSVAEVGGGRHYHADDGDELVEIFNEIANNLPTVLTE